MSLKAPTGSNDLTGPGLVGGSVIYVGAPSASSTTNRTSIQTALNSASPGDVVRLQAGSVYSVSSAGSQTFTSAGGTIAYCIEIPTGIMLDLNGSTLQLASGTIAILLCNANPGATSDTNIGLVGGGTLSSNSNLLTNKGLARFEGVTDITFDVKIDGADEAGIYLLNCTRPRGDIEAKNVTGAGIFIGSTTYPCYDVTFGKLISRNLTANVANAFNYPGNSVYANIEGGTIDSITANTCSAGIKLDKCVDLEIALVDSDICGDALANSGLKFQSSTAGYPLRTTVAVCHSKAQQGPGLYFDPNQIDCSVGTYVGEGNAILGTFPDVWVDGTRPGIGAARIAGSVSTGLSIRSTAVDYRIGTLVVRNPTAAAVGVSDAGGSGSIAQLLATDDQGSPKMSRGYNSSSANSVCHIGHADIRGATVAPIQRTTGDKVTVGLLRAGAASVLDSQTLATDAAFSLTPGTSPKTTYHTGTLTADRALTLSTTGVFPGAKFRLVRTGSGAFNITHALKNLATGQYAQFEYDGVAAAWKLAGFGSL